MDKNNELKTPQELALMFYNIAWGTVQCDDQQECEKVKYFLYELEKHDKKVAIRILLEVIEVKSLDAEFEPSEHNPFMDMKEFKYLNSNINNWPTNDYETNNENMGAKKEIKATFKGKDGSVGYEKGTEYHLILDGSSICRKSDGAGIADYDSVQSFLNNWENVKTVKDGGL